MTCGSVVVRLKACFRHIQLYTSSTLGSLLSKLASLSTHGCCPSPLSTKDIEIASMFSKVAWFDVMIFHPEFKHPAKCVMMPASPLFKIQYDLAKSFLLYYIRLALTFSKVPQPVLCSCSSVRLSKFKVFSKRSMFRLEIGPEQIYGRLLHYPPVGILSGLVDDL